MSNSEVELGPIDYLIVEWPPDKQPTGETAGVLTEAEFEAQKAKILAG